MRRSEQKEVVYTIGHSTRPVAEFIDIIRTFGIRKVIDVRTVPKSRHNPQFNGDVLRESLKAVGILYLHMKGLGGLRHARRDSPNKAWRNASFRGFADYMQTEEFEENLLKLVVEAGKQVTVIMCAEAVPWRCHRSLIGDALLVRGVSVIHIMGMNSTRDHELTPWAQVEDGRISYPETVSGSAPDGNGNTGRIGLH